MKMNPIKRLLKLLAALLLVPPTVLRATELPAAPAGNDANPGAVAKPFVTQERTLDKNAYGVWASDDKGDLKTFPCKGMVVDFHWSEIEPTEGVFDWQQFDAQMKQAADLGLYCCVGISVGPMSPLWLYEKGIPKVMTVGHRVRSGPFPYYLDSNHIKYYHRLIEEFGRHVRSLPAAQTKKVFYALVKTGSTQDEAPYKGSPKDPQYVITPAQWHDFRLAAFKEFVKAFQAGTGPVIPLLFNRLMPEDDLATEESKNDKEESPGLPTGWADPSLRDWVIQNVKGGWGHKQVCGHAYQLNDEIDRAKDYIPHLLDPAPGDYEIFTRCELDRTWQWGMYKPNIHMSLYWTALSALHRGLSVWHPRADAREWSIKNKALDYAFYFNKYAGQTYSPTATGAFCALREGLDAADTRKFPESRFGQATRENAQRYLAICAAYASHGAKMDSVEGVLKNQTNQRLNQNGLNDSGWRIMPGNYERFLHQIDPDVTSVGWWRVGGPVTAGSPVYGRFARGFEHATGKDAMRFDIKDSFFSGKPLDGAYPVTVRVVYYDEGTGQWALQYDAVGNPKKIACTEKKTDTKTWKEKIVTLRDGYFGNRCEGADLMLVNPDTEDTIFHIVELTREPR